MSTLLVFGDASFDQTFFAPSVPAPDEKVHCTELVEGYGGVALNTAIAAARAGAATRLVAQVGTDAPSGALADYLAAEGIGCVLPRVEGVMARVTTIVEPHGEKRLLLYPGVSLYPPEDCAGTLELDGIGHVHTAIYGAAGKKLLARARQAGLPWSLDLEPATFADGLESLETEIGGAALLFVNNRAAAQIGPDPVRRLLAMGARNVLRSQGNQGATLYGHDGAILARADCPAGVPVRDTTGAGDCLAGWYLARTLAGDSPRSALAAAVTAATRSCGSLGTHSGYPRLSQIEQ